MRGHLAHPVIQNVLTQVIGPDVKCMQSMLFIKASGQAWAGMAPGRRLYPHP